MKDRVVRNAVSKQINPVLNHANQFQFFFFDAMIENKLKISFFVAHISAINQHFLCDYFWWMLFLMI